MNWGAKSPEVSQEEGCLGGEGSRLDLGPAPTRSLFPPGSQPQRVKRFHSVGSLIQRHQQMIRDKSEATRHGIRIITRPKLLLAS